MKTNTHGRVVHGYYFKGRCLTGAILACIGDINSLKYSC